MEIISEANLGGKENVVSSSRPVGYRSSAVAALVKLQEMHLEQFIDEWKKAKSARLVLPKTDDRDYASLDTLCRHVLSSSVGYLGWICESLSLPLPTRNVGMIPEAGKLASESPQFSRRLIDAWIDAMAVVADERLSQPQYKSNWGEIYSIEAMLEHAAMHPLRHAFQLRNLKEGMRRY